MLKIKDNVSLKELEKFGMKFHKDYYIEKNSYVFYVKLCIKLSVNIHTRIIRISSHQKSFDLLFDLIQAGLVEKVVE